MKQNENYRLNKERANVLSEKDKFAAALESKNNSMQAHYGGGGS